MKKTLSLILAFGLPLFLFACGGGGDDNKLSGENAKMDTAIGNAVDEAVSTAVSTATAGAINSPSKMMKKSGMLKSLHLSPRKMQKVSDSDNFTTTVNSLISGSADVTGSFSYDTVAGTYSYNVTITFHSFEVDDIETGLTVILNGTASTSDSYNDTPTHYWGASSFNDNLTVVINGETHTYTADVDVSYDDKSNDGWATGTFTFSISGTVTIDGDKYSVDDEFTENY
jgi:hypothetical protein